MKLPAVLLVCSLALNAAFALVLGRSGPKAGPLRPGDPGRPVSAEAGQTGIAPPAAPQPEPGRAALWQTPDLADMDPLIARLRAAGCTKREIRVMLYSWVNDEFERKRSELRGHEPDRPYWDVGIKSGNRANDAQVHQLMAEEERTFRRLVLHPDLFGTEPEEIDEMRRFYGSIPTDKVRALTALHMDFAEKSLQALAEKGTTQPGQPRYGSPEGPWDELNAQRVAAVKRLLTPEEYAELELHAGAIASDLRSSLGPFRPTQAEFDAIYAIEKSVRATEPGKKTTPEQQAAQDREIRDRVLAALSPDRAADYEQLTAKDNEKLNRLMVRLELPLATIGTINAVRDATVAQAKAVQADPQLTEAQRSDRLAVLARDAETRLTATLGARGFDAYNDIKGEWLRNLNPKTGPGGP